MFAGIGTFSIIIAKSKNCEIDSVDSNPAAFELGIESLKLNRKLKGSVKPILSDSAEYARTHANSYDRILMPLPERAGKFLALAVGSAKSLQKATIHYYVHVSEEDFRNEEWISRHLSGFKLTRDYEVSNWKRVREVGPKYIQAVADVVLL